MSALVLVADHDPFNLRLLEEACDAAGYDVVTAADGQEVLAMVARQTPDVVVLDSAVPTVDGFEVVRILKSDANLCEIPVVLVTDSEDVDARSKGIELGAEDYLTRPYRVFEIQQRIRNVLRAATGGKILATIPPADQLDPATGAGTPSQLLLSLDYEHTRAVRYGHPLTCLLVRVVNQQQLADAGREQRDDRAMALIGSGIRGCIRAVDHLFRVRRDEFCVLLPETDAEGAQYVLKRLQRRAQNGDLWEGALDPAPQIATGLSTVPSPKIKNGNDLLHLARAAI